MELNVHIIWGERWKMKKDIEEMALSLREHKIWAPEKKNFKHLKKNKIEIGFNLCFSRKVM